MLAFDTHSLTIDILCAAVYQTHKGIASLIHSFTPSLLHSLTDFHSLTWPDMPLPAAGHPLHIPAADIPAEGIPAAAVHK